MSCVVLVCAKARLLVATGTPIAPHSFTGLDGLEVQSRWVRIPRELLTVADLRSDADTVEGFCRQFGCQPTPHKDCVYTMHVFAAHT